jgi:butyryl-CoA dehydrogenase/short/branched chain acyl-CoA dehydrogenase
MRLPSRCTHSSIPAAANVTIFCLFERIFMSQVLAPSSPAPQPLVALTEDELLFRDNVRQFADETIRPKVREMDEKGIFDQSVIQQFFQLGLMGIEIPEQYGGAGGTFFESILAVEEISSVDPSAGVIVDVQNTLVNNALMRWTTEEQKKRYLPKMASDTVGAYALSEAGSGSDAFALQTRAELKGSEYVLNGRKLWITNAKEAGIFILLATVDPSAGYRGITAFIVEKNFSGFSVGKKEDKLGIRASSTCELILEDCRVPKENVLGQVGKGYKIAIETLNEGRIGIGAQMAGLARGAWEHAFKYAQERKQFGKTISEYQGIQFQLAQMATEIEAARMLVYNAARMKDAGMNFVKEAAMTKLFASQVAERVASLAVEIYGGYGFTKDYPVEKYYRDAKIGKIYEGTSNMQLQTIAKLLLSGGK